MWKSILLFAASLLFFWVGSDFAQADLNPSTTQPLLSNAEKQAIAALAIKTEIEQLRAIPITVSEEAVSKYKVFIREIPQSIFPFRLFYSNVIYDVAAISSPNFFVLRHGKYRILEFGIGSLGPAFAPKAVLVCAPEMVAQMMRLISHPEDTHPKQPKKQLKKLEQQMEAMGKRRCEDMISYFSNYVAKILREKRQVEPTKDEVFPELVRLTTMLILHAYDATVIQSDVEFDDPYNREIGCGLSEKCPHPCVEGTFCWDQSRPAFSAPVLQQTKEYLRFQGWVKVGIINNDVEQIEQIDLKITPTKITFEHKPWVTNFLRSQMTRGLQLCCGSPSKLLPYKPYAPGFSSPPRPLLRSRTAVGPALFRRRLI